MKKAALFLSLYLGLFVLLLFLSKQFNYHFDVGTFYLDMLFSIEQATVTFCFFLLLILLKKKITYWNGIAVIIISIIILSVYWYLSTPSNADFFTEYFFKPIGFSIIEIPHFIALLFSVYLSQLTKVNTI